MLNRTAQDVSGLWRKSPNRFMLMHRHIPPCYLLWNRISASEVDHLDVGHRSGLELIIGPRREQPTQNQLSTCLDTISGPTSTANACIWLRFLDSFFFSNSEPCLMLICGHVHIRKSIETSLFLQIWNGFCLCALHSASGQKEKISSEEGMRSSIFVAFFLCAWEREKEMHRNEMGTARGYRVIN